MKKEINKLKGLGEYWFKVIKMVGKASQFPTMKTSAQRPEKNELKEQKGRNPHATTKTQCSQINQNKH